MCFCPSAWSSVKGVLGVCGLVRGPARQTLTPRAKRVRDRGKLFVLLTDPTLMKERGEVARVFPQEMEQVGWTSP